MNIKATKKVITLTSLILAALCMNSFADTVITTSTKAPATKNTGTANKAAPATTADSTGTVTVASGVACGAGTACMVVSDTSNKAIDLINKNASTQMTNVVTSQFDFALMTKFAMGNNWKLATPEQQTQLVSLFQQLLIYTYSTAISKFKGAKTNIISATVSAANPKKPELQKTAVVCQITLPNSGSNTPIKVEYDLANNTGRWLAYDIKIENASLVTTYRTQFNDVVQKDKIPGLIKQLQEKVDSLKKSQSVS